MRCILLSTLLILLPAPAFAGKVFTWRHAARADWETAKLANIAVSPTSVGLTQRLQPLADLKAGSVWELARTPAGKLVAATAEPGQVVEVDKEGQVKVLWKDDATQTFALLPLADGSLLAGTGPAGKIFKLDAAGKATEFAKLDALYVWDLLAGPDGSVFAATGPKGKIFKLAPDGAATVFHETKQQHVLTLASGPNGALLAGTDGPGLVLSIDPKGAGRVLLDCGGSDVRALTMIGNSLYAATAGTSVPGAGGSTASTPGARPTPNSIYRLDASGAVTKLFTTPALFYALASRDGEVVAGSGPQGQLYALVEGDARQLAKLDVEQILSMAAGAEGGLILGTGGPAKLFSLAKDYAAQGTLVSAPLDAKLIARYGALNWSADTPPGTSVTVAVRSGNTALPGDDWSAWSEELADAEQAAAACPAGRFLQYRVTLSTKDARLSPQLRSLSVRYRTANQPPAIATLVTPHVEEGDGKKPLTKLKLTWTATDPNQDDLSYALEFRKAEWNTWVKLKDGITTAEYEWDVTSVPEGEYRVRLVASDELSNPPEEALTATRVSEPFTVDCQPPTVEARLVEVRASEAPPAGIAAGLVKGGFVATLEAKAVDRHSPIVAASYAIDSGAWVNIFPSDRLFDSTSEKFRFDVPDLAPGLHVLVVRATDAAGHTASADVVFAAGVEPGVKLAK